MHFAATQVTTYPSLLPAQAPTGTLAGILAALAVVIDLSTAGVARSNYWLHPTSGASDTIVDLNTLHHSGLILSLNLLRQRQFGAGAGFAVNLIWVCPRLLRKLRMESRFDVRVGFSMVWVGGTGVGTN